MSTQHSSFRKLTIKQFPRIATQKDSIDGKYWKRFQLPTLAKEYGTVNAIAFSPVAPYDCAVGASARVQIYGCVSRMVKRTISRFKEPVQAVEYRSDGRLLAAGDGEGLIQLFDPEHRTVLRTLRGHGRAVHVTRFASNNVQLLSGSDDQSVRLWDIPKESIVVQFNEHQDYVRAGRCSTDHPALFITGSYDHTVRLWDVRSSTCAMVMQHGQPVEDVIAFPGGSLVVSAGGPVLKVWDLLAGGRLLQAVGNHQKTVTCLTLAMNARRLVTGSLDRHVKIYDPQTWKLVHSARQSAPVLSVGIAPDDSLLAVGMSSGMLALRPRRAAAEDVVRREGRVPSSQSDTPTTTTQNVDPRLTEDRAYFVAKPRTKKISAYDRYLRDFRYGKALDTVLSGKYDPPIVISLIQELMHRGALRMALSHRDDVALEPLLKFLDKHLCRPRYTHILIQVAECVLDIYEPVLGESPLVASLMKRLRASIHKEVQQQRDLIRLMGALDMIMSAASLSANLAKATNQIGFDDHDNDDGDGDDHDDNDSQYPASTVCSSTVHTNASMSPTPSTRA